MDALMAEAIEGHGHHIFSDGGERHGRTSSACYVSKEAHVELGVASSKATFS
jgi:hypothetical protein